MSISVKPVQNIVAYVRKPAESILSARKITSPIQAESLSYTGAKAQEQMPFVFKIHNNGLKRLYPQEQERCSDAMLKMEKFRLKGLPTTKNFNELELQELFAHLRKDFDVESFILMSAGARPAIFTRHSPLFAKIKSPDFDMVLCKFEDWRGGFVINKKAAFENIQRNKDFYTQRLNLPQTASEEEIYKILTGENSPFKNRDNADVIGMMLGFPRKDNFIFQLECDAGSNIALRENPEKMKEVLLKELHSPNCVYAKFDNAFKKELEDSINSITRVKTSRDLGLPDGYVFTNFVDDAPEIVRINKNIREATSKMEKINTANQKAADEEFWHNLTDTDPQKQLEEFAKSMQEEAAKLQTTTNPQKVFEDFLKEIQVELDRQAAASSKNPFDSVI